MMLTGKKMRVESRGFVGMGKKCLGWRIKRAKGMAEAGRDYGTEKHPVGRETCEESLEGEKMGFGEDAVNEKNGKGRRGRKAKKRDGTDKTV